LSAWGDELGKERGEVTTKEEIMTKSFSETATPTNISLDKNHG
jgi:hypothetical protein